MFLWKLMLTYAILATLHTTIHGEDTDERNRKEDLETQASGFGYGSFGGLSDVYDGGIYGRYPGYYGGFGYPNRGYYGLLNGLGTTGLGYSNLGYLGYNTGLYSSPYGYGNYYGRR